MSKRMNKRVSVVEPLPGWDDKEAVIDTRSSLVPYHYNGDDDDGGGDDVGTMRNLLLILVRP